MSLHLKICDSPGYRNFKNAIRKFVFLIHQKEEVRSLNAVNGLSRFVQILKLSCSYLCLTRNSGVYYFQRPGRIHLRCNRTRIPGWTGQRMPFAHCWNMVRYDRLRFCTAKEV